MQTSMTFLYISRPFLYLLTNNIFSKLTPSNPMRGGVGKNEGLCINLDISFISIKIFLVKIPLTPLSHGDEGK